MRHTNKEGSSNSIQDLITKFRDNKSLSHTLTSNLNPSIVTPQPIKRKTKIILKRYKSNLSLGRPTNKITTVMQQYTESNKSTKTGAQIEFSQTLNLNVNSEILNCKCFRNSQKLTLFIVPESLKSQKSGGLAKKPPFSYPLPPRGPDPNLGAFHRRNRSSLLSTQSNVNLLYRTEKLKTPVDTTLAPLQKQNSFYETFNERY